MANLKFLKKQIKALDKGSEDFFEVYKMVWEKYWDFDDPDHFQQSAKAMAMFAERGDEQLVIVLTKMMTEMIKMDPKYQVKKCDAVSGTVGFKDKEFYFTVSTDKTQIAKLQQMMMNMAEIIMIMAAGLPQLQETGVISR